MRLRIAYRLDETQPEQEFVTDLFLVVSWESQLNRKISDGRGLGYEDLAYFAFLHETEQGRIEVDSQGGRAKFTAWLRAHRGMQLRFIRDETDPNPTEGAPTDAS